MTFYPFDRSAREFARRRPVFALVALLAAAAQGCGGGGGGSGMATGSVRGQVTAQAGVAFKTAAIEPTSRPTTAPGTVGVAGATVTMEGTNQSAVTDADGFFTINEVSAGSHILIGKKTAADGTVYAFLLVIDVQTGQVLDIGEREATKAGAISGRATLDNQTDATGIAIFIPGTSLQARTDAAGSYTISDVPAGTYDLRFEMTGYGSASLTGVVVAAGGTAAATNVTLNLSTGPYGSITLENGKTYANSRTVAVAIAPSSTATLMQVSEDVNFVGSVWNPVSVSRTWTFASDGSHRLYVKFADTNGLESSAVFDDIVIDTGPPFYPSIVINGGAATAGSPSVILALSAADGMTWIAQMKISDDPNLKGAAWEPFAGTRNWTLPSGDGTKTIYAAFMDAAGNESSQVASATIVLDTAPHLTGTAPTSPSPNTFPIVQGTAEPGATIRLYTVPDATGTVVATGMADSSGSFAITVSVAPETVTTFYADATGVLGITSPLSSGLPYISSDPPEILSASVPAGTLVGCIPIDYTVRQALSRPVSVTVELDPGTGVFSPATATSGTAVTNIATSSTGIVYQFPWNSSRDLSEANVTGVRIRVSVYDLLTSGRPIVLNNLSIFNAFAFAPRVDLSVESGAESFTVGDLNLDGIPDIAVVITPPFEVALYLGRGDGTFLRQPNLIAGNESASIAPVPIAMGDLTGDGKPDLAVGSYRSVISVFPGNGDGSFGAGSVISVVAFPTQILVDDINGDGKNDILSFNADDSVSVFLGDGNGAFIPLERPTNTPMQVYNHPHLAVADFNGDGKKDLATLPEDRKTGINTISIQLGNGNGTFQAGMAVVTRHGKWLKAKDFNGDGKPDVVVGSRFEPPSLEIFLGNGDGTFGPVIPSASTCNLNSVTLDDFNQDGKCDIVVMGAGLDDDRAIEIHRSNGDGTFRLPAYVSFGQSSYNKMMESSDVDLDGKPDLIVLAGAVTILRNFLSPPCE